MSVPTSSPGRDRCVLLVTSAGEADGGGHDAVLGFDSAGELIGPFSRDPRIVDPRPVDRGDRGAGSEPVDADTPAGVLQRQRAGQVLHPALADAVAEIVRLRDGLVNTRDIDDDARAAVGQEALDRFTGAQEGAPQVHGENPVEVAAGQLVGRTRDLDTGVVDQDVEPAETLRRLLNHPHDVVLGRDIALDEDVAHPLLPDPVHTCVHLRVGFRRLVG